MFTLGIEEDDKPKLLCLHWINLDLLIAGQKSGQVTIREIEKESGHRKFQFSTDIQYAMIKDVADFQLSIAAKGTPIDTKSLYTLQKMIHVLITTLPEIACP